ncbi:MAG TPA: hypothetical protein VHN15_10900 [Thermoanaerobaculia bacterium]|nr:hypothetical protein [Thermoanaerobaculia bacterium]
MMDYDENLLRRYLLDQLGEDEKEQVEQRLLADDDLFEAAEAVEGDLLHAYVRGELTAAERQSIDRRLAASPRGKARLDLARGMSHWADSQPLPAPRAAVRDGGQVTPFRRRLTQPLAGFALAASLLLAAALGVWTALRQAPQAQDTVAAIEFSTRETHLRGPGGDTQTAALSPAEPLLIKFPDLQQEDFPAFEVVVRRDGEEVTRKRLESGRTSVEVPGEKLPEGRYGLEVRGLPADGEPRPVILSEFEIVAE